MWSDLIEYVEHFFTANPTGGRPKVRNPRGGGEELVESLHRIHRILELVVKVNFVAAYHLFQGTGIQRIWLTPKTSAKCYNAFSFGFFFALGTGPKS
jgi:hypothetical protein